MTEQDRQKAIQKAIKHGRAIATLKAAHESDRNPPAPLVPTCFTTLAQVADECNNNISTLMQRDESDATRWLVVNALRVRNMWAAACQFGVPPAMPEWAKRKWQRGDLKALCRVAGWKSQLRVEGPADVTGTQAEMVSDLRKLRSGVARRSSMKNRILLATVEATQY